MLCFYIERRIQRSIKGIKTEAMKLVKNQKRDRRTKDVDNVRDTSAQTQLYYKTNKQKNQDGKKAA